MKPQTIGLAALLAGTLFASEPTPEEIKLQNQYVEYRLSQGEIYRVCVKMNDGVTTVQFPSAITEIAGKNVSADGKGADFIIQAQPGSYYFNLAAMKKGATGTLTVTHNRKLYILYLVQSDKEAYASVVFGRTANRKNLSGPVVTATPKVSPARLVSLIDLAKKYDVLAENHPETVAGCERVKFKTRYRCGKFDIHLLDATRFEEEDTVIFHVELENLTAEEIAYDKHSFSAHAGNGIYYMSVSDATGLMPPKSRTHAWFGITSTPEGGRNNLKADNDWLLAVTTREMHTSQLQSVVDEVKAEREKAEAERKKLLAEAKDAKKQIKNLHNLLEEIKLENEKITKNRALLDEEKSRFQKETDQTRIRLSEEREELKHAKEALDAEKAELQKATESAQAEILAEKQQLRESKGIMQTAEILRKMREDTRNAVKTMRERSQRK